MKRESYGSIRKKILTSMIMVPFVPFVLILSVGFYYFKTSVQTTTIDHMKRIAGDHRQMIESFLDERKSDLEFIADSLSFRELSVPEKLLSVFRRLQKESSAFVDLGIFNSAGIHVAYIGPYSLTGKEYKETLWFTKVMENGYFISDVFLGYRRIPHFVIAIARGKGDEKWVIRATIDTHTFSNLVNEVRIGTTGEAYILNSDGIFQTKQRSGGNLMEESTENFRILSLNGKINTFIKKNENQVKYLYATAWMKEKSWLLVVRQEADDAFQALHTAMILTILIMVLGGGLILITAYYLTSRIIRQMEKKDAEKESLSHQLVGASRLAELGEMAAGFAHEINNPLQIIKSEQALIEMLLSEFKTEGKLNESESLAELEDSMDQIKLQISRCSKITQSILKFGRQDDSEDQVVNLQIFIPEVIEMIEKKALVHGISVTHNIDEAVGNVYGDPAEIQQVLLNLFNNAIHAVIEKHGISGGELTIDVISKSDKTVMIQVKDNGCGITPENMKKIFSPFFTTKPVGEGTGLGLSVCYGIIEDMGGVMEVNSKEGTGTVFTIHLPLKA